MFACFIPLLLNFFKTKLTCDWAQTHVHKNFNGEQTRQYRMQKPTYSLRISQIW